MSGADWILVQPSEEDLAEVWAYRADFLAADSSMDGTGPLRRMESPEAWLAAVRAFANEDTVPEGWVQATQFLCLRRSDRRILGMLQLRHRFNAYLEKYAGHIGYSVRPSERRQGVAAWMLASVLPVCRELGLERVLITCEPWNEGSRRTILANGGVYEKTVHEPEKDIDLERYWITIP